MSTELLYKRDRVNTNTHTHTLVSLLGNRAISVPADWTERNKKENSKSPSAAAGKQGSTRGFFFFYFSTFRRLNTRPPPPHHRYPSEKVSESRGSFLPRCQQKLQLQRGSALRLGGETDSPSIRGSLQPD